jgi:hypothetical protein
MCSYFTDGETKTKTGDVTGMLTDRARWSQYQNANPDLSDRGLGQMTVTSSITVATSRAVNRMQSHVHC